MRALIIDDEAQASGALRRTLEDEGVSVDVADNGHDGLSMATTHAYDFIVMELLVPGMSGIDVCEQLRSAGNWTPILVLTAVDGEHDHVKALDTGADDYLTKPFSFVVLSARLRALVRRSTRGHPLEYRAGELVLEPAAHRCTQGEVEVTLTSREFAVLEFLMQHTGEVVSKAEILDNVWDFAFSGDPNIVEVYIHHLRRKLDSCAGGRVIETVRGAGYRLVPDGG